MGQCNRLIDNLVRLFPTADRVSVARDLDLCRKQDRLNTTDWEGNRARFKKAVMISFRERHNK